MYEPYVIAKVSHVIVSESYVRAKESHETASESFVIQRGPHETIPEFDVIAKTSMQSFRQLHKQRVVALPFQI